MLPKIDVGSFDQYATFIADAVPSLAGKLTKRLEKEGFDPEAVVCMTQNAIGEFYEDLRLGAFTVGPVRQVEDEEVIDDDDDS